MATKPLQTIKFPGIADTFTFLQKDEVVRYDAAQSLTSAQKAQARENIGAGSGFDVDDAMSSSSTNPVQNKVIKAYVDSAMSSAGGYAAPMIYDDATPADIVSVTDGANNKDFKSLVANITPIQTGTGDPSPSNIRPITGWTGAKLTVTGKNLFALSEYTTGSWSKVADSDYADTYSGKKYSFYHLHGDVSSNADALGILGFRIPLGRVTISFYKYYDNNDIVYFHYVGDNSWTNHSGNITSTGRKTYTSSSVKVCDGVAFDTIQGSTANGKFGELQIEIGESRTDYVSNTVNSYACDWTDVAGTIYGGTIDFVSGKLIVTDGYIASYNGETLPSTWLSDRDVYAEGTTPTTGAEVVYKLATPTEYTLTGLSDIKTKYGSNNIWADCGSIASVSYPCDTKLYIDAKVSALMAVLSGV